MQKWQYIAPSKLYIVTPLMFVRVCVCIVCVRVSEYMCLSVCLCLYVCGSVCGVCMYVCVHIRGKALSTILLLYIVRFG